METLMVFVLIVTHKNEPTGEEFYFQELTSCLESVSYTHLTLPTKRIV